MTYPRVPDREGWWVWAGDVRHVGPELRVGPRYDFTVAKTPDCWHGPAYCRTEDGEFVAMVEEKRDGTL